MAAAFQVRGLELAGPPDRLGRSERAGSARQLGRVLSHSTVPPEGRALPRVASRCLSPLICSPLLLRLGALLMHQGPGGLWDSG